MITLNSASFIAKDIFQLRSNEIGLDLNFSIILDISNFDDECEILVKYDYPFYAYFIWS